MRHSILSSAGSVVEHLSELSIFFAEARRVLRPMGRAIVSAMHPAMFLIDVQTQFRDPNSGEKVRPGSVPHTIGDMVMAAIRAGFRLDDVIERLPDAEFAKRFHRAERFIGWPMLVVLQLSNESNPVSI